MIICENGILIIDTDVCNIENVTEITKIRMFRNKPRIGVGYLLFEVITDSRKIEIQTEIMNLNNIKLNTDNYKTKLKELITDKTDILKYYFKYHCLNNIDYKITEILDKDNKHIIEEIKLIY